MSCVACCSCESKNQMLQMCFCFCFSVGYLSTSRAKKQVKESDKKSYFLTFISNIYFYLQPEETLENTGTALGAYGLCLEHKSGLGFRV